MVPLNSFQKCAFADARAFEKEMDRSRQMHSAARPEW